MRIGQGMADAIGNENPSIPQGEDYCTGVVGVEPDDTTA